VSDEIPELEALPDIHIRKQWIEEEEAIMRTYYGRKDPAAIAAYLNKTYFTNRTSTGVCEHARRMKAEGRL
jgi:hypothetical protein